jgi:hypothetical protein
VSVVEEFDVDDGDRLVLPEVSLSLRVMVAPYAPIMLLPELSATIAYNGILVDGLHSRGAVVFSASVIECGVPAKVTLTVTLDTVIVCSKLPDAKTLPVPLAPLKVLRAKRSDDVGALTNLVQTTGFVPLHPGEPEETFATTGTPALTLIETDLAAEALVGTVMTTLEVTVTSGPALTVSSDEESGAPRIP